MANINDYLKDYGETKLSKLAPLNELDQLILARFSYLPFKKIKLLKRETIGTIAQKMSVLKKSDFRWPEDQEYIELLGSSKRFAKMRISDYVNNDDSNLERQFSAVTIHLNLRLLYISYFGTDESITGWKEDFNLAVLEEIPAQVEGHNYLKRVELRYFWKKIHMGGHSKGGNVAIFAAIKAKDRIQKKIQGVYNYDGPGLRKKIADKDTGSFKILKRIHSFIPQESVIGRLFEHQEGLTVVYSVAENVYQHDIYSWQIKNRGFVRSKTTKRGDLINHTINKWMQSATQEEMKIFIDGMFEIFTTVKLNNPIELMREWKRFAPKIVKEFLNTPKEQKKAISDIWWRLGESLIRSRIEQSELLAKFNRTFKRSELKAQKHSDTKSKREKIF